MVHALPRDATGQPRTEILQLVAMNQLDLIEPMMKSDEDRAFLRDILDQPEEFARPVQFRGVTDAAVSLSASFALKLRRTRGAPQRPQHADSAASAATRTDRCRARDIRLMSRRTSASGRKAGRTSGGTIGQQRQRRLQMLSRLRRPTDRSPRAACGVCLPANTSSMPLPCCCSNCSGTNSCRRAVSCGNVAITSPCHRRARHGARHARSPPTAAPRMRAASRQTASQSYRWRSLPAPPCDGIGSL